MNVAEVETAKASPLYVLFVSLVAATSGLLFGFDIAVINGAIVFLRKQWRLTEWQTEYAASSLLVGCVFGAACGGWVSDRLGRKKALFLSAILFTLSALGAALPRNLTEFAAARFAGGIAIGAASVLAPMYIAEVSPARIRGRLVSLNQMTIVTGILLSYFVNWVLSYSGPESWRWMFAVAALPSVTFFVALFFVPESPRWLVEAGREREAFGVLARVNGAVIAGQELGSIRAAVAEETGTLRELIEPGVRRALVVAVVLAVMQQWTGVNSVLFYGSVILTEHVGGHTGSAALGANVLIGLINFLMTFVAIALIDKAGRKALLIASSAAMGACLAGMAVAFRMAQPPAYLVIALMLMAVASFAAGLGPGVWVVLSEIFPNRIRGRAMSIATVSLWVACAVLTMTFLTISRLTGPSGAFLLYSGMCAFTAFFVWRFTPETRGRTLEEIEKLWKRRQQ
jgi:SP family arabinose:H+ symporter-like MFS transporter